MRKKGRVGSVWRRKVRVMTAIDENDERETKELAVEEEGRDGDKLTEPDSVSEFELEPMIAPESEPDSNPFSQVDSNGEAESDSESETQTQPVPGIESELSHMSAVELRAGVASECGPRPKNDDAYARSQHDDFFALSDGIGGAPHGDVISRIACKEAVRAHDEGLDVVAAFDRAAAYACKVAEDVGDWDGATLLLAERAGDALLLAGVGDTHAYLWRDGCISLQGIEGRADPSLNLQRNALDKAVGANCEGVRPDVFVVDLAPGDWVVLCSDGVWDYLGEDDMAGVLAANVVSDDPFVVADALCGAALLADGRDNATCWCLVAESTLSANTPDFPTLEETPALSGTGSE